jgi:CspA family cold shock protein
MAIHKFLAALILAVSALTSATAFAETGTVKYFNETKGYGFIKMDSTGKEYFVDVSGLIDRIVANDRVQFDIVKGRKGTLAVNVRVIPK